MSKPKSRNNRLRQIGKYHTYLYCRYGDDWLVDYVTKYESHK